MFQKYFNGFSVIFNVENILNERQTKYEKVVLPSPTIATPQFKQLYMPLEGIVANVSLWVRL